MTGEHFTSPQLFSSLYLQLSRCFVPCTIFVFLWRYLFSFLKQQRPVSCHCFIDKSFWQKYLLQAPKQSTEQEEVWRNLKPIKPPTNLLNDQLDTVFKLFEIYSLYCFIASLDPVNLWANTLELRQIRFDITTTPWSSPLLDS